MSDYDVWVSVPHLIKVKDSKDTDAAVKEAVRVAQEFFDDTYSNELDNFPLPWPDSCVGPISATKTGESGNDDSSDDEPAA